MRRASPGRALAIASGLVPVLVLVAGWLVFRWDDLSHGGEPAIGAAADLPALLGLTGLVVLVTLGTRLAWIERLFGLDRLQRLHRRLAPWVVGLFAVHAVLRTVHFSMGRGRAWTWSYLLYFRAGDPGLLVGHAAFGLVLTAAVLALLRGEMRLPFRVWKTGHLLIYPAVLAGFAHAAVKGWADVSLFPNNAVFLVLAASALALFGFRAAYRARRARLFKWTLARVVTETHDTTSLLLGRDEGPGPFAGRRAGQLSVIRTRSGRGWGEPHPFTISCEPESEELRFTIKAVGPFSSRVPSLRPGTPFLCEGPYGVFTPDFEREKRIALIAGGVGITPFLSYLRHAAKAARDVRFVLIWGNKTRLDIIAREELDALAGPPFLKVVHVLSREPAGPSPAGGGAVFYERGQIDAGILRRHLDARADSYYVCGPSPMQAAILGLLRSEFGVRRGEVRRELFFF
jgi:predicted ferric reductase